MKESIKVREYAGGRGGERPLEVFLDGEWCYVVLVRTWIEEELHTRNRTRHFILKDQRRRILHLFQAPDGQWYIMR